MGWDVQGKRNEEEWKEEEEVEDGDRDEDEVEDDDEGENVSLGRADHWLLWPNSRVIFYEEKEKKKHALHSQWHKEGILKSL